MQQVLHSISHGKNVVPVVKQDLYRRSS